jgi:hypothetical protein
MAESSPPDRLEAAIRLRATHAGGTLERALELARAALPEPAWGPNEANGRRRAVVLATETFSAGTGTLLRSLLWLEDGRLADFRSPGHGDGSLCEIDAVEAITLWQLPAILLRLAQLLPAPRPQAFDRMLERIAIALEDGARALQRTDHAESK